MGLECVAESFAVFKHRFLLRLSLRLQQSERCEYAAQARRFELHVNVASEVSDLSWRLTAMTSHSLSGVMSRKGFE
jgi:hypothetical protein